MTWLVTGGAGYIGSHIVQAMGQKGFRVVVVDDLSSGIASRLSSEIPLVQTSLRNSEALHNVFDTHNISGVVHLAAKKRVGESVERPDYYWQENVGGLQNLLTAMNAHNVKNFVFSSSAAVYGQPVLPDGELITEETQCFPINPYGATKLEGEVLSQAAAESNGLNVVALRYFNVAGAGRPELGDQYIFNLVPIVFDALDRGERPIIFGDDYSTPDGSCVRDYVHVQDLSDAHIAAIEFVEKSATGYIAINIGSRREGDPVALVADVSLAKDILGWQSNRNLRDIVSSAWEAWHFGHK